MRSDCDGIIVLGRGISPIGELPLSVQKCLQRAVTDWQRWPEAKLILSGKWGRRFDFTPPTTEAEAMQALALNLGVPPSAILVEAESLDTISNLYLIKTQFLFPLALKRLRLITVQESQPRISYLAQKIFGPQIHCELVLIENIYPDEKHRSLVQTENEKTSLLKEFLKDVRDGDHETIYQMHLDYLNSHQAE